MRYLSTVLLLSIALVLSAQYVVDSSAVEELVFTSDSSDQVSAVSDSSANPLVYVYKRPSVEPAVRLFEEQSSASEESALPLEYDWQSHRHSLTFSYGTRSFFSGVASSMAWLISLGQIEYDRYMGPFSVEYDYNVKWWLRVGGRFTYAHITNTSLPAYWHRTTWTGRVDFMFLNRRHVKLYGGVEAGVGMNYVHYVDPEPDQTDYVLPILAISYCPIGVQAGGDHVYVMAECNVGTSELLRIGIGTHF